MRRVMVDLETLAIDPRAAIVSIGAVTFDENGPNGDNVFYSVVETPFLQKRVVSADTIKWWSEQSEDAQRVFRMDGRVSLTSSLGAFNKWLGDMTMTEIWAGPSHFDIPILETALREYGYEVKWSHRNVRCLSTLTKLCEQLGVKDGGDAVRRVMHHNALDDARFQAQHAAVMLRNLKEKLK